MRWIAARCTCARVASSQKPKTRRDLHLSSRILAGAPAVAIRKPRPSAIERVRAQPTRRWSDVEEDHDEHESHDSPGWEELSAARNHNELFVSMASEEYETPKEELLRLYAGVGDEDDVVGQEDYLTLRDDLAPKAARPPAIAALRASKVPAKAVPMRPATKAPKIAVVEPTPSTRSPQVLELLRKSTIQPYIPLAPESNLQPQLHHRLLLSADDWRLSSPLFSKRRRGSRDPPSLLRERNSSRQGLNRLIGVGLDPARESKRYKATKDEPWGWKVKVPAAEKGDWPGADEYRKRPDRLLKLSREAAENDYLVRLARSGTPEQREYQGFTATGAVGAWAGEMAEPDKLTAAIARAELERAKGPSATNTWSPATAVSVWQKEDGSPIDSEHYRFEEGMILRFTAEPEPSLESQSPVSSSGKFWQGHLLEIADGKLVVAFKDSSIWDMGRRRYQIDKGLDDSAFSLQEQAINNLYYDADGQRIQNGQYVKSAQEAFLGGTSTTLREWTLQGTSLRELIVPNLDDPMTTASLDAGASSESAYQSLSASPVARSSRGVSHPSTIFRDNQLIHSWILRHHRDNPLHMPGDPELGLNPSQSRAVAMSLGESLSLIQGPPGTGKSQTIVSIIKLLKKHFRIPEPILLAAPTHVSVDHLLESLIDADLNPLRAGKTDKVRPALLPWTVEHRIQAHPLYERMESAREESEKRRQKLQDAKKDIASSRSAQSQSAAKKSADNLVALEREYQRAWRLFIWYEQRLHASLLGTADVFCATAIGSGSSKVMNMVNLPIVFVDEAAMCTEPVNLIPLMKGARHVTLIGDHKQLPAVVTSEEAKAQRLQTSLFERLMTSHSKQAVQSTLLDTQYRMRPSISAFPRKVFYGSDLKDDPSVRTRPPPPISRYFVPRAENEAPASTVLIAHTNSETKDQQTTFNREEARIILSIVADLLFRNPTLDADQIGIISPYVGQTRLLRGLFGGPAAELSEPILGYHRAQDLSRVEVNTIDGFQGREKSVIILSTVRSNAMGYIGFLTDKRRLNVALTRARDALFVVGNPATLATARQSNRIKSNPDEDPEVWEKYVEGMRAQNLVMYKHLLLL